ncbi:MAG: methyltransferase domain-containing protein [Gammaproteobacteria bacterium]|nr:methyltransferase domain-containing protein [Gammaproteobacteria bacterium]
MFQSQWLHLIRLLAMLVAAFAPSHALAQLEWRDYKDWIVSLEDPKRLAEIRMEDRLAPLDLKPGMVVADIGAGTGVFSRALATAVGPSGVVYAEDIQQGLIDYINKRSKEEDIRNIVAILGDFDELKLPASNVDLAWSHNVLHAMEDKESLLRNLVACMRPESRIALTEWDKYDPAGLKFHDSADDMLTPGEANEPLSKFGFYPVE